MIFFCRISFKLQSVKLTPIILEQKNQHHAEALRPYVAVDTWLQQQQRHTNLSFLCSVDDNDGLLPVLLYEDGVPLVVIQSALRLNSYSCT